MSSHATAGARQTYLSAAQVRIRYGGVSDMALWRWLHDRDLGFPAPIRIKGRRFWLVSSLIAWELTRAPTGMTKHPKTDAALCRQRKAADHPLNPGTVET